MEHAGRSKRGKLRSGILGDEDGEWTEDAAGIAKTGHDSWIENYAVPM